MEDILYKINKSIDIGLKNNFYKGKIHRIDKINEIEKFPVLCKEDLLKLSVCDFYSGSKAKLYEYHESSGSTNTPLVTWFTQNDFMAYVEQLNESPVNFNENDVVLIRFPYALSVPAHTFTQLIHKNGGCVIHAGRGDNHCGFMKTVELLKRTQATVFACNVQEAFILAIIAQKAGYDLKKDFGLRAICTAGEVFTNARKKRLEELWGVPIYNFYGTTELGNLAVTESDETLLASTEHFYFEVLNPNDLSPVKNGDKGMLYVTTLSKELFPMIRYCTGDIVTINDNDSSDSRHLKKIKHHGRVTDVITYENSCITFAELQNELLSLPCSIIGNMWRIKKVDNGIIIFAESELSDEITDKSLKLNIDIPHKIELVKPGTIFNPEQYLHEEIMGKPKYFI